MSDGDMRDDELRRRLREVPGPSGGPRLDVAAAVERARRRRKPKVAAVTAAVTGAGVLIIAPFVVPGLSPLAPTGSSVLREEGEQDAGAAESAPEPAVGADDGSLAVVCHYPSLTAETGIIAAFADDPADGVADLELTFPASGGEIEVLGVGIAQVVAGSDPLAIVAAQDPSALEAAGGVGSATAPAGGGTAVLSGVRLVDGPLVACPVDAPGAEAPLLLIEIDGRRLAVVGEPWDVR